MISARVRAAIVRMKRTFCGVHADVGHAVVRLVPAGQHEAFLITTVAAVPFVVAAGGRFQQFLAVGLREFRLSL